MTKKNKKYKVLKVTKVHQYLIEMIDDKRTQINGWEIKGVVKDWFEDFSSDSHHATRDTHEVFGGTYVTGVEIVDSVETKKFKWKNEEDY